MIKPWERRDPLGKALHLLRMRGAFYSRTELSAPWGLEMPAFTDTITFHVVSEGSCWLMGLDSEAIELRPGDLALVPHGRGHELLSTPGQRSTERVDLLPQEYLGEQYSTLVYGGGGARTRLICGIVGFDEPVARQVAQALPQSIVLSASTDPRHEAVQATLRLLSAELGDLRPGGEAVTTRLADVLVVQAIRLWLEGDPAARTGWLGALRDEQIGQALAAIHTHPGQRWTLTGLAREAAMSRASFSARFTDVVGTPAMTYLTQWRMQVAHARLQEGGVSVRRLAQDLGYGSEAAFTRAFSRTTGRTPGAVRRQGQADWRFAAASPHQVTPG
jgi:AraC-like DNA-binding protein